MGILKNLVDVVKVPFADNSFLKAFSNSINPPKDYQKEIAENFRKINEEMQK